MDVLYISLNEAREALFAQRSSHHAPEAYRARLDGMNSSQARARSMAGLWLLQQGLARLEREPEAFRRLGFDVDGRPELAGGPHFSISHAAGVVACALSMQERVGLDVEQRRPGISAQLRRRIAPTGDFFDAWCAREATVKATGRVGLARMRQIRLSGDVARLDERDWHIRRLLLADDHAACLATRWPLEANELHVVDYAADVEQLTHD